MNAPRLAAAALCLLAVGGCGFGDGGQPGATGDRAGEPALAGATDPVAAGARPGAGSTAPTGVRTITIAATGDVLPHSPLWRQAAADAGGDGYDFGPMFAEIEPVLASADLAICHLETPIAPVGEEYSTSPLYGVPPEIAEAIAGAGFDRCSTASNHAVDRGVAGVIRTVDVLEAAGVAQSGMARTEPESRPRVFEQHGIAISHLSYTYGLNGNYVPPGEDWRAPLIDADRIVRDAMTARELGAELVIASLHWGTEGEATPTASQREVAEAVTASGEVDLIIGHHTHVLQPIEQINGVWVAFGLGNILSNLPVSDRWPASTQDAAIVEFSITVADDGFGGTVVEVAAPSVRPTWVDKDNGWVIRDVLAELHDPSIGDGYRRRLQDSLSRTFETLGDFVAPSAHTP